MLNVRDDTGVLPGSDVGDVAKKELAISTGKLVDDAWMDGQAEVAGALLLVVLELSLVECDVAGVFLCADGEDGVWCRWEHRWWVDERGEDGCRLGDRSGHAVWLRGGGTVWCVDTGAGVDASR